MRLGIITYDHCHLKTEQVCIGLKRRGVYASVAFFALPFQPRPPRRILFEHRPDMQAGAHTRAVATYLGADYHVCSSAEAIPPDGADLFLILGAGLLPASFVQATRERVLNSHPGIIPAVRGLDAFKWAIHDGVPIGNTLHLIDEEADAGEVLAVLPTPVFESDTLHAFARRHYENEIAMMIDFDTYLGARRGSGVSSQDIPARPAKMRMPLEKQSELESKFEAYKRKFSNV